MNGIARSTACSVELLDKRSRTIEYAIASVSEVPWKIAPDISNERRSSAALTRLPLWTSAMLPLMWRITSGWILL